VHGVLRSLRLAAACLVLALAVGVGAVLDHRAKQHRIDRAQVADWYCRHEGLECGGEPWRTIEHRWQVRQYLYEGAVALLAGIGVLSVGYRLGSRDRPPMPSSSRSGR
jgi:hypothetical protein